MLTIRQPVSVKFILTESTKQRVVSDLQQMIAQITNEMEQIEEQGNSFMAQAKEEGPESVAALEAKIQEEMGKRIERREQLIQQLSQIQQMELGTEIPQGQVETTVDVRVGDDWNKILMGAEIVVKDGIVVEIRRAGEAV
jgi:septal ring factor EnvC (AmiA/AmiB activator)